MLTKLSAQDKLLIEKENVEEKLQQVNDEFENSQKAIEYYQNDVIPEIQKQMATLKVQMDQCSEENEKLKVENVTLRGSFDDRIKHFETENQALRQETIQA